MTILLVYSSHNGQTEKISRKIAQLLEDDGHHTLLVEAADTNEKWIVPESYSAILVGAPLYVGGFLHDAVQFIQRNLDLINKKPNGFFSVSLSAAGTKKAEKEGLNKCVDDFLTKSTWKPGVQANFAGALNYTKYGFFKRWMMKRIVGKAGGDTDTSRDFEYTDWDQVSRFAREFAQNLENEAQTCSSVAIIESRETSTRTVDA